MIAKIIAYGRDRDEALGRLHRALAQMTVLVRGGTTNKSFLLDLLDRPEVIAGADRHGLARPAHRGRRAPAHAPRRRRARRRRARRRPSCRPRSIGPPSSAGRVAAARRPTLDVGHEIELRHGGQSYRGRVSGPSGRPASRSTLDGVTALVDVERLGRVAQPADDRSTDAFGIVSSTQDSDHLVEVDGVAHRFSRDDAGIVRAPASALVVGVDVAPGRRRRGRRRASPWSRR